MAGERTQERLPSDEAVKQRLAGKRRKELTAHRKEAGEVINLARSFWGFDKANYDGQEDTVFLQRGGMTVSLVMDRNTDSSRRSFVFNMLGERLEQKGKTAWGQIKAFLGVRMTPTNVRELTEIRKVPLIIDPKGRSEARQVVAFDGDNKPAKLLALVFIEREGVLVPESWKLVERGRVSPSLPEGRTVADMKPSTDWYLDVEE